MPLSPTNCPRISFCITAKNRTSHIRQTLPRNLSDNIDYPNLVFVILDYCDSDGLLDYLCINHMVDIESGRVVVYSYREPGAFKMAHAKNMAHCLGILSGADILVNLDADNYTGRGFARYVADQMADTQTFLWANIIPGQGKQFRGCNGRICVTRDQFILSGGYDEKFSTWSPDDKDFNARLIRMGYSSIEIDRQYLRAIPHKDGVRFREYPHAQRNAYEYEQRHKTDECSTTIANWGRIGCGTVYRNLCDVPTVIRPIPTRIFGVGLHKTATNSLHKALTVLGIDSAHWGSPKRARSIWQEMKNTGKSPTIDHHCAWLDLPIPLLFRELDHAYRNSKFILTIRDESRWLSSVQNHWDYDKNVFRSSWDTDPFTHLIHKELYGCKWPSKEVFIGRYRRHNAAVIEYFKSRPDQLLILNVDAGEGWPELCKFIGVSDPPMEYPREYTTIFDAGR